VIRSFDLTKGNQAIRQPCNQHPQTSQTSQKSQNHKHEYSNGTSYRHQTSKCVPLIIQAQWLITTCDPLRTGYRCSYEVETCPKYLEYAIAASPYIDITRESREVEDSSRLTQYLLRLLANDTRPSRIIRSAIRARCSPAFGTGTGSSWITLLPCSVTVISLKPLLIFTSLNERPPCWADG
jgi:hypothetical protein